MSFTSISQDVSSNSRQAFHIQQQHGKQIIPMTVEVCLFTNLKAESDFDLTGCAVAATVACSYSNMIHHKTNSIYTKETISSKFSVTRSQILHKSKLQRLEQRACNKNGKL